MRRSVSIAVLFATMGIGIAGLGGGVGYFTASAQQKPESVEVKIDNFSFGPAELTVAAGTTVTWTNRDDIPHTVVSTDKVFKSKVLDTDEKYPTPPPSPAIPIPIVANKTAIDTLLLMFLLLLFFI